eukprot:12411514-Karenia_brevis.AAC.1
MARKTVPRNKTHSSVRLCCWVELQSPVKPCPGGTERLCQEEEAWLGDTVSLGMLQLGETVLVDKAYSADASGCMANIAGGTPRDAKPGLDRNFFCLCECVGLR